MMRRQGERRLDRRVGAESQIQKKSTPQGVQKKVKSGEEIAKKNQEGVEIKSVERVQTDLDLVVKGEKVGKDVTVAIDEKVAITGTTQKKNLEEVPIGTQKIDTTLRKEKGITKRSVVDLRTIIVISTPVGRIKTTKEAGKNGIDCLVYLKLN